MILKKFTSILTLLTLLFTLAPFNYAAYSEILHDEVPLVSLSDAALSSAESSAQNNSAGYDDITVAGIALETNEALSDPFIVFDAQDTSDVEKAVSYNTTNAKGSVSSDATSALSGSHTLKLSHAVLPVGSQYEAKISRVGVSDITAYSYININMWSPEATDEKLNIILNNSGQASSKRIRYILYTDWQGWKTISIPYSSHSNNSLTSLTKTVDRFNINIGGWNFTKAKAGYFLVDKIWLTNSVPASASISSSEYENGAVFVPEDLGGDKTFSFTFDKDLASVDMTSAVALEKYNGSGYEVCSDAYTAYGNGNKLDVKFENTPADATYKITLDPKKICTGDYVFGSGEKFSYEFSVNMPSPYFSLSSSSPADEAVLQELKKLVLSFNNDLDSSLYIPDYISLYCDGDKVYNGFTSSVSGKELTLEFGDGIEKGHSYVLSISPSYTDNYGNKYIGDSEISFIVEKTEEKTKLVVFNAAETANFDVLDSEYEISTEITNLYPQTAKLDYEAGDKDLNAFITRNNAMNTQGMKYLNFLAYSPIATENPAYIILYANNALTGNKYEITVDWSGWQVISIPVSSISTLTSFDGVLFTMGTWKLENKTSGYILFDAVWFSKEKPEELKLQSQSFPNNFAYAALNGQNLSLTFNSVLDTGVTPGIFVADSSGNEFTDYTYSVNDKNLNITFGDLGLPQTEYTLTLSSLASADFSLLAEKVVIKFTAASSGVFVNDISYSPKTVSFEIENLSDDAPSLTLTAYAIGEDNYLIEKRERLFSATKGIHNETISFSSGEEIMQVKAFVLNENKEYVSSKYFSYKNSSSEMIPVSYIAGNEPKAEDTSYSFNVNLLTLTAGLSGVSDTAIVEITSSGEIISANVVNVADGLTYYYVFPSSARSAVYPAKIYSGNNTFTVNIKYISKSDCDVVLSLANAGDESSLAEKLKTLKAYLPFDASSDLLIADFSKLAVLNKPYASYDEVMNYILSLNTLLNTINSDTWSELPDLIDTNSELFKKINNADVTYFLSLTGIERGKLCQLLPSKLPAATVSAFVSKLSEAVSEYKLSLSRNNGAAGNKIEHTASASVTGGSVGGASFSSSVSAQSSQVNTDTVFKDIETVSWAKESIIALYNKGIISKADDGKFRPDDNITREEFTKLVVCAFLSESDNTQKLFSDSVEGAWYNKYLSIAYNSGVVFGYPDSRFGVGENITREDMATVCMRAFALTGKALRADKSFDFYDKAQISDYAIESVTKMTQAGIINGMGDGSFAPKSYATRAQAAKIIAALLSIN